MEQELSLIKKVRLNYDFLGKELRREDRDFYKIRIHVEADEDTLQKIEKVEYTLHKTFKEPLVLRTNREKKFQLTILLWGEFTVKAVAFVKDNSNIIEVPMALYLDIFPRKRLEEGKLKIKEVLGSPEYRWRTLSILINESGLSKEEVLKICREDENIKESLIPSIKGDRLFREIRLDEIILKLKDKDPDVRRRAAMDLGRIGDARAVEPLISALKDKDRDVCNKAEEALEKIGAEAVEPLIGELKDGHASVRANVARTLGRIGSRLILDSVGKVIIGEDMLSRIIEDIVNALTKVSKNDTNRGVRDIAKEALKEIEAKQKSN